MKIETDIPEIHLISRTEATTRSTRSAPPALETLSCRSCGASHMESVLTLGAMPLANGLAASAEEAKGRPRYPLDLVFCPACGLVQITETVDPRVLFRDYLYFSSYSETMLEHARNLSERLVQERRLNSDSLVVELASNDGYLLRNYVRAGIPVLGIEPARNVAEVAEAAGVPTFKAFFDAALGARLATEGRRADVIHAHNVLAHVADANSFVRGMTHLLKPGGLVVLEVPYLRDLLQACEFDTIYHEHLAYFSLTALDRLLTRNGLTIRHVERLAIHGGSLRVFADREPSAARSDVFVQLWTEEQSWGVGEAETYKNFGSRVRALRDDLRALLRDIKQGGGSLAAYGAAAKGSTLLNYLDLGPGFFDFVVDRSPHKQGKFMPGLGLFVHPPEFLLEVKPDYCLILAWNFAEEIIRQQSAYRSGGGRFIVPIPRPRILDQESPEGVERL